MTRYETLLHIVNVFQPRTIIEVGTWSGDNAIRMLKQIERYRDFPKYTGFDLFEGATAETDALEMNVKAHNEEAKVWEHIKRHTVAEVTLVKGNTRETLRAKKYEADFAFIDGGHSVETIESDYEALKHVPVIVLDDYYTGGPDIEKYGCNKLAYRLREEGKCVRVLPHKDLVKGGGHNQLVLVLS
jgi:predicted O-methyltransferase YrrM